jgi:hypothetical protein
MTSLLQRQSVPCPYGLARKYLESELTGEADNLFVQWTLHVEPVPGAFELSKEVDVTVTRGHDPLHFDQPWNLEWTPHAGGPYPAFTGTLTVRADEDWNAARLELIGSYDPPFGPAGKLFDAIAGTRIARATAKTLLTDISRRVLARYGECEARKAIPA